MLTCTSDLTFGEGVIGSDGINFRALVPPDRGVVAAALWGRRPGVKFNIYFQLRSQNGIRETTARLKRGINSIELPATPAHSRNAPTSCGSSLPCTHYKPTYTCAYDLLLNSMVSQGNLYLAPPWGINEFQPSSLASSGPEGPSTRTHSCRAST